MDSLDGLLNKLQAQVLAQVVDASAKKHAEDAKRAMGRMVAAEATKLKSNFDKRALERKAQLDAALHELQEAEAALKQAHQDAAGALSTELRAVADAHRAFDKAVERKGHEFNGCAEATIQSLVDVTQNRARGHVTAMRADFEAAADETRAAVVRMCVKVENVAALLDGQLSRAAALAASSESQSSMAVDDDAEELGGY